MAVNPVLASHLKEARRELVEQRVELTHEIDAAIAQIDSMLEGYNAATPAAATMASQSSLGGRAGAPLPSMRDAILTYMIEVGRDVTTNEVAVALAEKYGWSKASARSLISKMGKNNEIYMRRRGVYGVTHNAPVDTSGSAENAEPEGDVTTSGAGGEAHAPDHDPGVRETERIADRGGGDPAVAGSFTS